jgi:tRNA-splicing endonuclease subunit Sen34
MEAPFTPNLPIPISMVGNRYLLFDVNTATWLRRVHRICGVALGTLPVAPAQNLFLGVPIEIMPEEAQLLLERGIGVVVDDSRAHDLAVRSADQAGREGYLASLEEHAGKIKRAKDVEKAEAHRIGMEKRAKRTGNVALKAREPDSADFLDANETGTNPSDAQEGLRSTNPTTDSYVITPATSQHLLQAAPSNSTSTSVSSIEDLPSTYPLYRHLHDKNYFMTPGLRFGCQYTVYPGDPLRFHSHFLAIGTEWDQEIDLMDIVGGGRLGTGVKKGFLIGGEGPRGEVRTFSVEWAAM